MENHLNRIEVTYLNGLKLNKNINDLSSHLQEELQRELQKDFDQKMPFLYEDGMVVENEMIKDSRVLENLKRCATYKYSECKTINWGKRMQDDVEDIVIDIIRALTPVSAEKGTNENNGTGYDINTDSAYPKLQVKLRQKSGKKPYSHQINIEVTRRHSQKNKEVGKKTGQVPMRLGEFNAIIIILVHYPGDPAKLSNRVLNDIRGNIKNWYFSIIPTGELVDPDNFGYCVKNISPQLLEKYAVNTKNEWVNFFNTPPLDYKSFEEDIKEENRWGEFFV